MAEVEIVTKPGWRTIVNVTISVGPSPPSGEAIVQTDTAHSLTTGERVIVSGVTGMSGVNNDPGSAITVQSADTFSIDGSAASGTYSGGGVETPDSFARSRPSAAEDRLFVAGGGWYKLVYKVNSFTPTVASRVKMYKSTNSGASWAEIDSANAPRATSEPRIGVYFDGMDIWIASINSADGVTISGRSWERPRVFRFHTATDLWDTTLGDVGPLVNPPNGELFLHKALNGKILLYYRHGELRAGSGTVDFNRPAYAVYDATSDVWDSTDNLFYKKNNTVMAITVGAPNIITTNFPHGYETGDQIRISGASGVVGVNGLFVITVTGVNTFSQDGSSGSGVYAGGGDISLEANVFPLGMAVNDNLFHLFCGDDRFEGGIPRANLHHMGYQLDTDTQGDVQLITQLMAGDANGLTTPIVYTRSGVDNVFAAWGRKPNSAGTTVDALMEVEGTSTLNPSWSTAAITTTAPPALNNDVAIGDAAYDAGSDLLWLFWWTPNFDPISGDDKPSIYYSTKTPGGAWATPTEWKVDAVIVYSDPVVTLVGTTPYVVYTKIHPNDLAPSDPFIIEYDRYPHIDFVNPCPPASSSRRRYAYFRQLPC